jgi:hypothetical protein
MIRTFKEEDFETFKKLLEERGETVMPRWAYPYEGIVIEEDGEVIAMAFCYFSDTGLIAHASHYIVKAIIKNPVKIKYLIEHLHNGIMILANEFGAKLLMTTVNPKLSRLLKKHGGVEMHPVTQLYFDVGGK